MDNKHRWKSVNTQLLLYINLLLATFAFKATVDHFFRFYKVVKTSTQLQVFLGKFLRNLN
jgi:hypothetical protein